MMLACWLCTLVIPCQIAHSLGIPCCAVDAGTQERQGLGTAHTAESVPQQPA